MSHESRVVSREFVTLVYVHCTRTQGTWAQQRVEVPYLSRFGPVDYYACRLWLPVGTQYPPGR